MSEKYRQQRQQKQKQETHEQLPFTICSEDRQLKEVVLASSLEQLKIRGCEKFGINYTECQIFASSNDNEVGDDDVLFALQKGDEIFTMKPIHASLSKKVEVELGSSTAESTTNTGDKYKPVRIRRNGRKGTGSGGLGLLKILVRSCDTDNENNVTTLTQNLTKGNVSDEEWTDLWSDPEFRQFAEISVKYQESRHHLSAFISSRESLRGLIPESILQNLEDNLQHEDNDVMLPEIFHTLEDLKHTFLDILRHGKTPDKFMRVLTNSCIESKHLEQSLIDADALEYWKASEKEFSQQWDMRTIQSSFDKIVISLQQCRRASSVHTCEGKQWKSDSQQPQPAGHTGLSNVTCSTVDISEAESNPKSNFVTQIREPNSTSGQLVLTVKKPDISLKHLVGSNMRKISQLDYYKICGILAEPHLNPDIPNGFLTAFIPFVLQRVKMRGCKILQPNRIKELIRSSSDFQCDQQLKQGLTLTNARKSPSDTSCPVSRLDCITCLLGLVDDIVAFDLLSIMSQFPMALPLVMRNINSDSYSLTMPLLRGITMKWETGSGKIMEHSLFINAHRMVVAVRLGSNLVGKSTILNQVLRKEHTFSSCGEPSSKYGKPVSLDGTVELVWLTPETCKDAFWSSSVKRYYESGKNEIALLANLHGDANDFPEIIHLLSQFSCRYLVFLMPDCNEDKWNEFAKIVGNADDTIFYMYVDPRSDHTKDSRMIQTCTLLNDDTVEKVRHVLQKALQCARCSVLDTEAVSCSASTIRVQLAQKLETETSTELINFVMKRSCKKVKEILELQKFPYGKNFHDKTVVLRSNQELRHVMKLFTAVLFQPGDQRKKAVFHLETEFSRLSNVDSQDARDKVSKLREELRGLAVTDSSSQRTAELRLQIAQSMKEIDEMNLGVEHLFREMASVYEIQCAPGNGVNVDALKTPKQVAQLFLEGQTVELLDGDMGDIPLIWFESFTKHVSEQRYNLRVFVVSIIGLQSCGKSTLLNSLFACRFAASVGRCSRGLFMRLLFLDDELKKSHNFEAILLIDTEGLGSPEKMTDPDAEKKDRLLATFAMGISNLTLIDVLGENMVDITEILQIAVVTMTRLEKADIAPDILMVQCLLTEKNTDRTSKAQDNFVSAIRNAIGFAEKKADCVGMRSAQCLRVLFERISNETLLMQFHPYKDGATVNAPPSEFYHDDVILLYNKILECGKSSKTIVEFSSWCELVASYWESVAHEDFALRFKNIKEMQEFIDRGHRIARVKQAVDAAFGFHERKIKGIGLREISGRNDVSITQNERSHFVSSTERILTTVPTLCANDYACDQCRYTMQEHESLFEHIRGKAAEEETMKTIEKYVSKTREATTMRLIQTYDALDMQRCCCFQYDQLINDRLRKILQDSQQGCVSELQHRRITDDIFGDLKQMASDLKPVVSVEKRFGCDLGSEYATFRNMLALFRQKDFQFVDAVHVETDKSSQSSCVEVFKYLETAVAKLPNAVVSQRCAECYEDGMIRELKEKVTQALDDFHEENEKLVKHLDKMIVHVWAQQLLHRIIKKLQESWDEKNDPLCILKANEPRYKEIIKERVRFGYTFKSEGRIIGQHLVQAIRQMTTCAANEDRINHVLDLGWTTNSEKVRLQFLKELACEVRIGNRERALRYFRSPKQEIEAWYKEKVDSFGIDSSKDVLDNTYTEHHKSVCVQISRANSLPEIFVVVNRILDSGEIVGYKPGVNVEDASVENFEVLRGTILEALEASNTPPAISTVNRRLPSIDRSVMARLGCTERCFWCGALCWGQRGHDESSDDTRRHHSSHQPHGLIGSRNRRTRVLLAHPCHETGDTTMVYWSKFGGVGIPWQVARSEHFNDWMFDRHHNSKFDELMRWFFQELNAYIAKELSTSTDKVLPATRGDMKSCNCVGLDIDEIIVRIDAKL